MTETAKKGDLVKGFLDLVILCLLLAAAGFGGYFWGLHERFAPVVDVPPGTPGAISRESAQITPVQTTGGGATSTAAGSSGSPDSKPATEQKTPAAAPAVAQSSAKKYWLTSQGADYDHTGYSITVKVNDVVVDNFFGPGKTVDVTRHVKPGDNVVEFEAKSLGEDYSKNSGDKSFALTVKLVSGPTVSENFKSSDELVTYSRNASEHKDFNDVRHFKVD